MADLPLVDDALRLGKLSYSKVRALTRVATPENEEELLLLALDATAAQVEFVCRKFRGVLRIEGRGDSPPDRYLRKSATAEGMVRISAQLLPEEAAVVWKAVEAALVMITKESDVPAGTSSIAGALVAVAGLFLDAG